MFLWQPDYGSEDDRSFESNLLSKKLVAHPQSVSEDEDQSINIQSYAGLEELPKGIEIELASQHFFPEVSTKERILLTIFVNVYLGD